MGRGAQGKQIQLPGLGSALHLVIGDAAEHFSAQPVELMLEQDDLLLIAADLMLVAIDLLLIAADLLLIAINLLLVETW